MPASLAAPSRRWNHDTARGARGFRKRPQYLTAEPNDAAPLAPRVTPDRQKVEIASSMDEMRAESAFASSSMSRVDRWRRRQRFLRGLNDPKLRRNPIIYAEGDSWFQFPFFLQDIVNHLSREHLVWCTSAAGDTLRNMVYDDPEYLKELADLLLNRGLPVRYFLLSGAGNDVVGLDANGKSALDSIVNPYVPGKKAKDQINETELKKVLGTISKSYEDVLKAVEQHFPARDFPDLKVVIHGYDRSPTRSVERPDANRPVWARDWTGEPLRRKGFPNDAEASAVVSELIDRLNEMTKALCEKFAPRAIHADLRDSVGQGRWVDELHPTSQGYGAAANRLRSVLG